MILKPSKFVRRSWKREPSRQPSDRFRGVAGSTHKDAPHRGMVGRVRGIMIRFPDKGTPLQVIRADSAMMNAKELIEAIVFRMSEQGKVDAKVIDFEGKPLIRRIHWKDAS